MSNVELLFLNERVNVTGEFISKVFPQFPGSNVNVLHFTCFGFRAMRIDKATVAYFLFTHLLGDQITWVKCICIVC